MVYRDAAFADTGTVGVFAFGVVDRCTVVGMVDPIIGLVTICV